MSDARKPIQIQTKDLMAWCQRNTTGILDVHMQRTLFGELELRVRFINSSGDDSFYYLLNEPAPLPSLELAKEITDKAAEILSGIKQEKLQ
jgi:hypothetical protein